MKISLEHFHSLDVKTLFKGFSFALNRWVGISWLVMIVTGLALLAVDGFLFYRYGLGHAPPREVSDRSPAVRAQEDVLKGAAAALRARQAEFAATTTLPADFPNPFR